MIKWLENHLFVCYIKSHWGFDCPGCGIQRSFIALLKGHLAESFHYHAATIPFIVTLLLLFIQLKVKHVNGGKWVMYAFVATSLITLVQFICRQVILFS